MLAEEEAATSAKKASPKAGPKKAQSKPAGPGAIAAAGAAVAPAVSAEPSIGDKNDGEPEEIESFAATGIDNALDLMAVVTAKMDKASVGNQAATSVEKHPEVRAFIVPEFGCLYLTLRHSPSAETIQGTFFFFPFSLVLRVVYVASRPHSMLTWSENCPISGTKYAAHLRVWQAVFLRSLFSQQPGLRLQQYKVLRMRLRGLRIPMLISVRQ